MDYEVTRLDRVDVVEGADGYAPEGPWTTFFDSRDGALVLGAWSRRLASFRTDDLVCIRALGAPIRLPDGQPGAFPITVWSDETLERDVA